MPTTPSGLQYDDLAVGEGSAARSGQTVTVHYTGWLTNDGATPGKKFDSSLDRGDPFTFNLGQGQVIAGWDEGVAGMKVGGKRNAEDPCRPRLWQQGRGGVSRRAASLVFDVELVDVKPHE